MAFQYAHDAEDRRRGLWEVEGRILFERASSILFSDGTRSTWLPRAKVVVTPLRDGLVAVAMPAWLAKDRGYV